MPHGQARTIPMLPLLPPLTNFDDASRSVVSYLDEYLPLALWSITRFDGSNQIFLTVSPQPTSHRSRRDPGLAKHHVQRGGTRKCAGQSHPNRALVRALSRDGRWEGIGAYVSIPILHNDGSLFGTLCGADPSTGDSALEDNLALLNLPVPTSRNHSRRRLSARAVSPTGRNCATRCRDRPVDRSSQSARVESHPRGRANSVPPIRRSGSYHHRRSGRHEDHQRRTRPRRGRQIRSKGRQDLGSVRAPWCGGFTVGRRRVRNRSARYTGARRRLPGRVFGEGVPECRRLLFDRSGRLFHDPKPVRDLGYGRRRDVPPQALEALISLPHGLLAPHRGLLRCGARAVFCCRRGGSNHHVLKVVFAARGCCPGSTEGGGMNHGLLSTPIRISHFPTNPDLRCINR